MQTDTIDDIEVHDAVARLVDRSLVTRTQGPGGGSQFRPLETIRAYGREHLQHHELADAIREGGASRMQPIILTTLTTIAGLLALYQMNRQQTVAIAGLNQQIDTMEQSCDSVQVVAQQLENLLDFVRQPATRGIIMERMIPIMTIPRTF